MAMLVASTACAGVLAGAAPARADVDRKPPSEKDRQAASELVKKAIARSQAGDHSAAIKIYLQAYTLVPNSLLLSNIGAEFQQDGMYKEALDYFCKYLEQDPAGTNAPYARSQAKNLQRQLGRKRVDDKDVCAAPRSEEPVASEPPVRAAAERGLTGERGDRDKRDVAPERDRPRERTAQRGPLDDTGEPRDAAPASSSGNSTLMYAGLGAGGLGVVAAGVGIYAGIQGKQISDELSAHDPTKPWEPGTREKQQRGESYNRLQVISLISSGVLIATGVVLFVSSRPDAPPERHDKTVVRLVPTGNGLAVFGRF